MSETNPKADLQRYLQSGRDAILWKLEGLSEFHIRRPLVPSGTNLLGLLKHLAGVEIGYFGETFDRPFSEQFPWLEDDAEANADMWATREESRGSLVALYRRVWAHSDATIAALDLEAPGQVAWWSPERREVTLHQILIHVIAETHRHAGHADIIRELIDGAAGLRWDNDNLPPGDREWWDAYRQKVQESAATFGMQ